MTRPRRVLFQSLEIHRPTRPVAPTPGSAPQKLGFADLLRPRRNPTAVAARRVAVPAFDGTLKCTPDAVDAPRSEDSASDEEKGGDARHQMADVIAEAPEAPPPWVRTLIPTPDMLEPLLPAAARAVRLGGSSLEQAHPLVASIALTVSRFCNEPAVDDSEGWRVRIPLRPEVLPDTTLELSVSSWWLQLRFETTDRNARDLLFAHREALARMLEIELRRKREVAISID